MCDRKIVCNSGKKIVCNSGKKIVCNSGKKIVCNGALMVYLNYLVPANHKQPFIANMLKLVDSTPP